MNHPEIRFASGCVPHLLYATKQVARKQRINRSIHRHENCTELLYVSRGVGDYVVDGYHYSIYPGDLLLYNQGALHEVTSSVEREIETYCFGIAHLQFDGMLPGQMSDPSRGFVRPSDGHEELALFSRLLYETVESSHNYRRELSESLLQSLLLIAVNLPSDERSQQQNKDVILSNRIRQYIDTHFTENLTLNDIGTALHVSPYYAAHVFKSVMNISPIQYMIRCRIGEAQNFLIASDLTANEIAAMVGYSNVNYFNELFKRKVGMPPIQYRKYYLKHMRGKRTQ
ncbi:MAG: AraC family transcriptional regulator [Eubacteriales bacterium]|nr:AraC family transcriptional regulator [Eubacteriales bacterium]